MNEAISFEKTLAYIDNTLKVTILGVWKCNKESQKICILQYMRHHFQYVHTEVHFSINLTLVNCKKIFRFSLYMSALKISVAFPL